MRLITKRCHECGEEFSFKQTTEIGAVRRKYCTECAKKRKNMSSHTTSYCMTAKQRDVARMYSPFTEHGPEPLPRDLVAQHNCTTFIRKTTIRGERYTTEFRK